MPSIYETDVLGRRLGQDDIRQIKELIELAVEHRMSSMLDEKLKVLMDKGLENATDKLVAMLIKKGLEDK